MFPDLKIILYPDPRLKRVSDKVEIFDENLAGLAGRMFELMRESKGVGLAAPQVGKNVRLFIINPTGEPADDGVYVNPILSDPEEEETGEEGCLSLPGIRTNITRARKLKIEAFDLAGKRFEQTETGYIPRIWQHEFDHLNGTLLIDRMGPTEKMENKKILKELEDKYNSERKKI